MKAKRILVPVDFSDSSIEGVKMAVNIANQYGSSVDLIHVIPIISYFNESIDLMEIPLDVERDLYPKAQKIADEKLREIAETYVTKEHRGKLYNVVGRKVFREIVDVANRYHDLIVMSNKGGHKSNAVRSHITEKVIQYAKVPVLSLIKSMDAEDVNQILIPLDGSKDCAQALIPAFQIASIFKAQLKVMHIIEPYSLGVEIPDNFIENERSFYEDLISNISTYFTEHPETNFSLKRSGSEFEDYLVFDDGIKSASVAFESIVKKGFSAHSEISDFANDQSDLVVMSTHGRTGISRVLLGSTTGVVAHHLKKPLLTFRPE